MVKNFNFSGVPEIRFGAGITASVVEILKQYGNTLLLVTGKYSFSKSSWGKKVVNDLMSSGISLDIVNVDGEPTTSFIDDISAELRNSGLQMVMAMGGGSVLDAGKAFAAMLPVNGKVWDYLEGNPAREPHPGTRLPLIAVPTTAGTGSEATKNAVLSTTGKPAFKRSLRHDNFVPDIAVVDPELTLGCPSDVTAASGLDAITQLLEAYVSTRASVMTDTLAYNGLEMGVKSIRKVVEEINDIESRSDMAYAALLSGIVLANAGLGAVHGFASVLGGHYKIPHGVACGTLLGKVTRLNICKNMESEYNRETLKKYARAGKFFCTKETNKSEEYYLRCLADKLDELIDDLEIPRLGKYGVKKSDVSSLAAETGIKNNPADLNRDDLEKILLSRL